MTALPEVPGIIEAALTISLELDGRLSFRVLLPLTASEPTATVVELIVNPEHVNQALAGTKFRIASDTDVVTFPCHIGVSSSLWSVPLRTPGPCPAAPPSGRAGHC